MQQPSRAAARLAVLALAGELATTYGITGWDEGEATTAAKVGFAAWNALRGDVTGNAEQDQVVQAMMAFVERHGDSRFSDAGEIYSERQQSLVRDRAGWWQSTEEGVEYLFTGDGMREALKGFDFGRAVRTLQQSGLLAPGADGKASRVKRIHARNVRVYVVQPEKLAAGHP